MNSIDIYLALAGRINQYLLDIERVVKRSERLLESYRKTADDGYLDGVALNLHGFYAGVESVFEDISRTTDGAVPEGANWHQQVLLQMAADIEDVRPAVITRQTRDCLDEFRAFRHLVRNVYTFSLKPDRLAQLAGGVKDCFDMVRTDLKTFSKFLRALQQEA